MSLINVILSPIIIKEIDKYNKDLKNKFSVEEVDKKDQ